ncbi:uncharacterized protein LOC126088300 [Schistocerca cancellata]|uniref:uncharacterized protein LOC126088300 n=1 Tax=Schistocerca cancellata TaxID=274614 RepID=UPI002117A629|nr:uncharacterized protein LOC126088300 [Schistocerca cancellata]
MYNFKIIHQNVQGLSKKYEQLDVFVNETMPDVLGISEHWLSDAKLELFKPLNMVLANKFCRSTIRGGGVSMYVKSTFDFNSVNVSKYSLEGTIELCAACIKIPNDEICVICLYRPPGGNFEVFLTMFCDMIENVFISHLNKLVIIGDFNINVLADKLHTRLFKTTLLEYNVRYLINTATRETETCQSAIDNIITGIHLYDLTSSVIISALSDHHAVELSVHIKKVPTHSCYRYIRMNTDQHITQLNNMLRNVGWNSVLMTLHSYGKFSSELFYILNQACPLIKKRIQSHAVTRNWISSSVTEARERLRWYEYAMLNDLSNKKLKEEFKKYQKYYLDLLISEKQKHFESVIHNSNNISKTSWSLVNREIGKSGNHTTENHLLVNGTIETDQNKIADLFNNYFASVGSSINNQLKNHKYKFRGTPVSGSIFLMPTSKEEIIKITPNSQYSGEAGARQSGKEIRVSAFGFSVREGSTN